MTRLFIVGAVAGVLGGCVASSSQKGETTPWLPAQSTQALAVSTPSWNATTGTLQRFERDASGVWQAVGPSMAVSVGRSGLAWGRGVAECVPGQANLKREGDGRAPAGVFQLSRVFGYAHSAEMSDLKMPYEQCTPNLECVDDANSPFYNQLVRSNGTNPAPSWISAEQMRRADHQYRLGVVVDHNTQPISPGGGSCIFLHIWLRPGHPTSGCTAMAEEEMQTLIGWLKAAARPVLLQFPRDEWQRAVDHRHLPTEMLP